MYLSKEDIINKLKKAGGRHWNHYGYNRIYFHAEAAYELTGGKIEFDDFGNVVFASLEGEAIPNNDADIGRVYFDITNMKTVVEDCSNHFVEEAIAKGVDQLIKKN